MMVSRRKFLMGSAASAAGVVLAPMLSACQSQVADAAPRAIAHGVASYNFEAMVAFEQAAGRFVRQHTYFRSTGAPDLNPDWEGRFAARHVARGTTPVLTLQLQDPRLGTSQPAYSHARIVAGDHDAVLRALATNLAKVSGEVVVRLMHEGNGDWYPWCAGANGNSGASYVAAWRHVVDLFRRHGAANVRWLWSMNKTYDGVPVALRALYPGDEYINQVGFSGYNGGSALNRGGWRSFADTFASSFDELDPITAKPRYVTETGCVEQGGDKATWIRDMWRWIEQRGDIAGVTWFDMVKVVDWRVSSSASAQKAYRDGAIATIASRS